MGGTILGVGLGDARGFWPCDGMPEPRYGHAVGLARARRRPMGAEHNRTLIAAVPESLLNYQHNDITGVGPDRPPSLPTYVRHGVPKELE